MGFGSGRGFGFGRGRGYGYGRGIGEGKGEGKGGISGFSCVKFVFFAFNVLFWLLGCAILGIGIWLQVSKGAYASLSPSFNFLSATVLCIAAGILVLLVGFFGCCGAIMENKCLLMTYFILVIVIFILEIVSVVLVFINRLEIQTLVSAELKKGIKKQYRKTDDEEGLKAAWAYVQSSFQCCGVDNYTDWYQPDSNKVPRECCRNITNCKDEDSPADWYPKGCLEELKMSFTQNLYILGILAICIAVVQILGLVASMALFCCLRQDKYYDE
jgi:tetraspanin-4